jgi:hypothetical protein
MLKIQKHLKLSDIKSLWQINAACRYVSLRSLKHLRAARDAQPYAR